MRAFAFRTSRRFFPLYVLNLDITIIMILIKHRNHPSPPHLTPAYIMRLRASLTSRWLNSYQSDWQTRFSFPSIVLLQNVVYAELSRCTPPVSNKQHNRCYHHRWGLGCPTMRQVLTVVDCQVTWSRRCKSSIVSQSGHHQPHFHEPASWGNLHSSILIFWSISRGRPGIQINGIMDSFYMILSLLSFAL